MLRGVQVPQFWDVSPNPKPRGYFGVLDLKNLCLGLGYSLRVANPWILGTL